MKAIEEKIEIDNELRKKILNVKSFNELLDDIKTKKNNIIVILK
ncbi:MAG: hypothetical protein RSA10_03475 [Bacilli bacterium]